MQDQYSRTQLLLGAEAMTKLHDSRVEIGRASCRERV